MGVNFVNCNQLGTGTVMKLLWHPSIDHVKVNTSTSENSETRRKKNSFTRLQNNGLVQTVGSIVPFSLQLHPIHEISNNGPPKTMASDKR